MTEGTATSSIEARLDRVRERIRAAAERAGRDLATIELLPITKGFHAPVIETIYGLGIRRIGENRVGEALRKQQVLARYDDLEWDMVGHIQSRKAEDAAEHFDRVHSVDRLKIARYLNRHAATLDAKLSVFLECNVSGEESKYGFDCGERAKWEARLADFQSILDLENLQVVGLMTMAPWTEDEGVLHRTFGALRQLRDYLRQQLPATDWRQLSMGMTDDYEIAVEEGATVLRLGRAIFGPRE